MNSLLTQLKGQVRDAVLKLSDQQKLLIREAARELQLIKEWNEFTLEERGNMEGSLSGLEIPITSQDLAELKKLLARDFDINNRIKELKCLIQQQGQDRIRLRREEDANKINEKSPTRWSKLFSVPKKVTTEKELDFLIQQLNEIKSQISNCSEVEILFEFKVTE